MSALIQYISPSSMSAYLSNPMYFKKRYIMGQRDTQFSVTGVIGSAGHKALETIYDDIRTGKPVDIDDAILKGQKYIDSMSNMEIKYNSTVSDRSKLLTGYNRAINFFVDELPQFHKIISVEEWIKEEAESELHPGTALPLPLNIRLDLLVANQNQGIEVIDHKFVYNYTNPDVDDFKRWLQAMFYYYAVKAKYGLAPTRMRFKECKTSGNKDGSPQIKEWVFEYDNRQHFAVFERLFTDVVLDMNNPGRLFLPNPGDMLNGQDMFELYRQDIMPVDAPIGVKHRTEEIEFVEKNFIASAGSTADTAEFTPEEKIRKKLQEFGVPVQMQETHVGPSVIKYTMLPSRGVRMSKIISHAKDIAFALAAESVRVEAPIPGTNLVGVEVPNTQRTRIDLEEKHFRKGTLNIPVGVDVFGEVLYKDLGEMPHLLIAGQTGAGKSVMLNVLLKSLTTQLTPSQLKLVLIDPKQVELALYENSKHLMMPLVTDTTEATKALDSMVKEMERRYERLQKHGVRKIEDYSGKDMPRIVVVIDEFADLMMMADNKAQNFSLNATDLVDSIVQFSKHQFDINEIVTEKGVRMSKEDRQENNEARKRLREMIIASAVSDLPSAEHSIIRIAQKARAVGIHLVLATQRPSAEVVTGLIKANIPAKIAFTAANEINSRIILDESGAEKLTGRGDMLYRDPSESGLRRLQGLYC